ncbi:unnamed protein product [Protopolystoma xenopodis]|uniref:Uncharacterized protein n=1 Tax=Protopolystoma xenopodis TaxID=117903 RepID=A0A3S5B997_9PLAT|nr:unnamed protein product [Protopolystoma xenopodis]
MLLPSFSLHTIESIACFFPLSGSLVLDQKDKADLLPTPSSDSTSSTPAPSANALSNPSDNFIDRAYFSAPADSEASDPHSASLLARASSGIQYEKHQTRPISHSPHPASSPPPIRASSSEPTSTIKCPSPIIFRPTPRQTSPVIVNKTYKPSTPQIPRTAADVRRQVREALGYKGEPDPYSFLVIAISTFFV